MKLSEYKIGDRVKYIFLGDYDGYVSKIHGDPLDEPLLSIILDRPAPVKFNMGNRDVMATRSTCIELIVSESILEQEDESAYEYEIKSRAKVAELNEGKE